MDNLAYDYGEERNRSNRSNVNNNNQRLSFVHQEKFHVYKNVLLISFSFLLLFTAFESMSKLQSSINTVDNLGTWANSAIYASLILAACFMPSFLIKKLKVKWTMVLSVITYSIYIAAQFYPEFYTLIPTAIILGMGAAPLWAAKCTYLTQLAHRLARDEGVEPEPIVTRFFGIFFFFFQCNSIIGNIISTSVYSSSVDANFSISEESLAKCGPSYCPPQLIKSNKTEEESVNENFEAAADLSNTYKIAGTYLALSFGAALILAILVDPLTRFGENERREQNEQQTGFKLLIATFRHMLKKKQILIIPITFWSGIEQGFFGADFTAGFVTCAYGVHIVGRVLIVYGVCDSLASAGFGFVIQKIGRVPIFLLGAAINFTVIVVMLSWQPQADQVFVVYILAALWGTADAIWQTQINALYGVLFPSEEEAAFSNYRLWESMGFLVAFITQACGVCAFPKLILAIFFLAVGMVGYLLLEILEKKSNRS